MNKALLLGLLLAAVVLVAAQDTAKADEKPKAAAADPTKGDKLAAKEGAAAAAGAADGADAKKKGATKEGDSKEEKKPKLAADGGATGMNGKVKQTDQERKKYAKMSPEERKAERESRMSERDKVRDAKMEERRKSKESTIEKTKADHEMRRKKLGDKTEGKPGHAGPHLHMMSEFRGTAGMFMALVSPVKPATVTFPLDDDTRLKFSAARDGLMKSVRKQGADLDVTKEETKKELRTKTKGNQEKTLEILLEAVKGGMTVQEARMGMVIAQFEALDDATKKEALEKAKLRQERMPSGARAKMNERLELKNKKERDQLTALKTDSEKEDFVKRIYRPRYNMATA